MPDAPLNVAMVSTPINKPKLLNNHANAESSAETTVHGIPQIRKKKIEEFINNITEISNKYRTEINTEICEITGIETHSEYIHKIIEAQMDLQMPNRAALERKPMSWWTDELSNMKKHIKLLARRKNDKKEIKELYRNAKNDYTTAIRTAKETSWQRFCSRAESTKDVSNLIKIIEGNHKIGKISLLKGKNGETAHSPEQSLDNLMAAHFEDHIDPQSEELHEQLQRETMPQDEETTKVIEYIDELKVSKAIQSFGPMKAAGPDDIKPIVLQMLDIGLIKLITKLYKWILQTGYTPKKWRQMNVIFLPKIGKGDYSNPKSYRPITLSSFMLKTLERVIQWYILENHIKKPLANQHAYTKGLSTETALSTVMDTIEGALLNGHLCLAVSLDCSGAFDKIKFDSATLAMRRYTIPENIITWYTEILKGRTVTVNTQGVSKSVTPTKGSPQGGVLSPIVWNMIMDTLLVRFAEGPIKVVAYADDVILLLRGFDAKLMTQIMEEALTQIHEWGRQHGLSFNPEKTTTTMFETGRKHKHEPPLKMNGIMLKYSENMRYLGVTLNKRLNTTPHIQDKIRKVAYLQNKIYQIIGREWGLNPSRTLWVHTAIIRPKITYGSIVWADKLKPTHNKKLNTIQRRSLCQTIQPTFRSTPTQGMEIIMGLIPLNLHIRETALNTRFRIRNLIKATWGGIGPDGRLGHAKYWDKELDKIHHSLQPNDILTPTRSWLKPLMIDNPSLTAYTDGSKTQYGTGCGWAITKNNLVIAEETIALGLEATVFQAELTAIQAVLLWLKKNLHNMTVKHNLTSFKIWSDSQSAIEAIYSNTINSKLVLEIIKLIRELSNANSKITIEWLRGHADNTGNELADMLAKTGTEDNIGLIGPQPTIPISNRIIKNKITEAIDSKWQRNWSATSSCRQTKLFMPKADRTKLKQMSKRPRAQLTQFTEIITGHGYFGSHLWYLHGDKINPLCELCEAAAEESNHIYGCLDNLYGNSKRTDKIGNAELNSVLAYFKNYPIPELIRKRRQEHKDLCDEEKND